MAPPRKKKSTAPGEGRRYHFRLPEDVADRLEKKAKAENRSINRIAINELAAYPNLERYLDFANQLEDLKILIARYSARITQIEMTEGILRAVDDVLEAKAGDLQSRVDRLRALRAAMVKTERDQ
jgi:hypothetical protein